MAAPTLDHLVVLARTLDEGAAFVRERLGVEAGPGGKHATMGTHNLLLSLGPEAYLEVMAIDPDAANPARPRWFSLDEAATRAHIARGPALVHWAMRTDDLEAVARKSPDDVEIVAFERGAFRWRMALTRDGSFPGYGTRATYIQWDSAHPAPSMPDSGCRLVALGAPGGSDARFATPVGERGIPWSLPRAE